MSKVTFIKRELENNQELEEGSVKRLRYDNTTETKQNTSSQISEPIPLPQQGFGYAPSVMPVNMPQPQQHFFPQQHILPQQQLTSQLYSSNQALNTMPNPSSSQFNNKLPLKFKNIVKNFGTLIEVTFISRLEDALKDKSNEEKNNIFNAVCRFDRTVIHESIARDFKAAVIFLLNNGANIECADYQNSTPLMAAINGFPPKVGARPDIAKLLIERGANVNIRLEDNQKTTPLFAAITKGFTDISKLLIEKGADVNAKTTDQSTLLMRAIGAGQLEVAKLLIENGADVNARYEYGIKMNPLAKAINNGFTNIAKLLIEKGADVNVRIENELKTTPLFAAINNGFTDIAKLLIENGADVNAKNTDQRTPLINAVVTGRLELAKLLIENGADVNARIEDKLKIAPLYLAIAKGCTDIAKLLIEKGAEVNIRLENEQKTTPLYLAIAKGFTDIAKLLIEKGADVNAKTTDQSTPLMKAISVGQLEVVKLLIEKGADVNAKTTDLSTPLMTAVDKGQLEIARLLIERGAEVNAGIEDQQNKTPFINAIARGHIDIAKLLLEKGCDIDLGVKLISKLLFLPQPLESITRLHKINDFIKVAKLVEQIISLNANSKVLSELNTLLNDNIDFASKVFASRITKNNEAKQNLDIYLQNFTQLYKEIMPEDLLNKFLISLGKHQIHLTSCIGSIESELLSYNYGVSPKPLNCVIERFEENEKGNLGLQNNLEEFNKLSNKDNASHVPLETRLNKLQMKIHEAPQNFSEGTKECIKWWSEHSDYAKEGTYLLELMQTTSSLLDDKASVLTELLLKSYFCDKKILKSNNNNALNPLQFIAQNILELMNKSFLPQTFKMLLGQSIVDFDNLKNNSFVEKTIEQEEQLEKLREELNIYKDKLKLYGGKVGDEDYDMASLDQNETSQEQKKVALENDPEGQSNILEEGNTTTSSNDHHNDNVDMAGNTGYGHTASCNEY